MASAAGRDFTYTAQQFSASTNCTGTGGAIVFRMADANGTTTGVGNNDSLLITANINANAPNASATFDHWDLDPDGPGSTPAIVLAAGSTATSRTICIVGFQSGNRDLVGHYVANANVAPVCANDSGNTG